MKIIQDDPIYILNDDQVKHLKEHFKREQVIFYTCSICGKKNIKSTLRAVKSAYKLCIVCASKKAVKEKYGVDNVFQLEKVKEKIKQTNIKRYGVENPFSFNGERYKKFVKEKYGVDNVFQNEEIKEKIKKTNLKKYGTESISKSKKIKEITKQHNLEKYNVEYPIQLEEIKEKIRKSNLEKYGSVAPIPFGSDKFKKIIKEKYGVDNISKSDDIKRKKELTCLKHFGFLNPLESKEIREKIKQTMIQKYGVEHALQYPEFFNKSKYKYFYNNIKFDSSWELAFWIYNKEYLNKNIIREPCKFEYYFNNKKYIYYPDFSIDRIFYEIKGDHFFENRKMINPFNRKDDNRMQEKYNCMISNNVKILLYNDIKPMLNYVNLKYGINYLSSFRKNK